MAINPRTLGNEGAISPGERRIRGFLGFVKVLGITALPALLLAGACNLRSGDLRFGGFEDDYGPNRKPRGSTIGALPTRTKIICKDDAEPQTLGLPANIELLHGSYDASGPVLKVTTDKAVQIASYDGDIRPVVNRSILGGELVYTVTDADGLFTVVVINGLTAHINCGTDVGAAPARVASSPDIAR